MENLTIREAAERLGVTTQAVNDLIDRGILVLEADASPKRVTVESLRAWMKHKAEKRQRIAARIIAQAVKLGLVEQ